MIEERVKAVIAYSGLNDSAFAKKIGVQQMTLWRQINGARKVSLETVMAIAEAFPEIDANWMLRGSNSMLFAYVKVTPDMATECVRKVCEFIASTRNF